MAKRLDDRGRNGREGGTAPVPAAKVRPPLAAGMHRERLTRSITDGPPGVRVVQGFAGTGKTTVLAHAARAWPGSVVWVAADGTDRVGDRFARVLTRAVRPAAGPTAAEVSDDPADPMDPTGAVFAAIEALEGRSDPTLMVIDDAHELAGAPAAEAVDLLCRYLPSPVTLVLGVRHLHGLDHWRWPSSDRVKIDADHLRFRFWEVETLFRDHYGVALGVEELRSVTRHTDGWAVALHLFNVGTRNLPAAQRLRLLAGPRLTIRSLRDYLTEQVLSSVDPDDRCLLRQVAVFDRIRPDRCDGLLQRHGSADPLRRLADVGLLQSEADGATYRLHDLLRAHLLGELDDLLGPGGVAGLHRLAADVLEEEGAIAEAVRACGRGGDWEGVRRLLARDDSTVALSGHWAEHVPPRLRDTDPWVLRSIGRRQLGEGDLDGARSTLAVSLERFREHGGDAPTRRSLRVLDGWLTPDPGQYRTWTECLRAAFAGRTVETWPDEPLGLLAEGLAHLAAGRIGTARALLGPAAAALGEELGALAELALALAAAFGDADPLPSAERSLARARETDAGALVAVAESVAAYAAGSCGEPAFQASAAEERNDLVGGAVHSLVAGFALLEAGSPGAGAQLDDAAGRFRSIGLTVPGALAHAAATLAHARAGRPEDHEGDAAARQMGPLPHALALLAETAATGDPAGRAQARALGHQHGFDALLIRLEGPRPVSPAAPLEVRCLGELRVTSGGADCELERLRPRHQELLGILVAHPNIWLHREKLCVWLWPDAPTQNAVRNLQVAISAVRKVVEPHTVATGHPRVVVRNGERYRMVVAETASDVGRLDAALRAARTALRAGDAAAAGRALDAALAEWQGEPVAAAGPTDWAVELRRRLAQDVGGVAVDVVGALRAAGDRARAAALAARAVEVDLWDDRLWRLAVATAAEAGSTVLAADLEQRYRALAGS